MSHASETSAAVASNDSRGLHVRTLSVPPATPWDQAKAARLEAHRNAPVRNLRVEVKRLGHWKPGKGARFAAIYARTDQISKGLTTRTRVEGQVVKVRFAQEGEPARRAGLVAAFSIAAGGVVIALIALSAAFDVRAERERGIAEAEDIAALLEPGAAEGSDRAEAMEAVSGMADRGEPLEVVLGDLAGLASSRDAGVSVEAVHWRPEGLAVEVRGDDTPFIAEPAERSSRPIRPGVWVWALPHDRQDSLARIVEAAE